MRRRGDVDRDDHRTPVEEPTVVPFKFLLLSAALAAILAAIGVTAVMAALNPSASEVASNVSNNDPLTPPEFYGTR
ncbi:hypothetical protein Q0Z83_065450 [Actinoplanes sichuanensis]|nr:hypothetical protein Q0Z83_065450 [Actinoplanes sichuanensis]